MNWTFRRFCVAVDRFRGGRLLGRTGRRDFEGFESFVE
jgi:hypothetical protein